MKKLSIVIKNSAIKVGFANSANICTVYDGSEVLKEGFIKLIEEKKPTEIKINYYENHIVLDGIEYPFPNNEDIFDCGGIIFEWMNDVNKDIVFKLTDKEKMVYKLEKGHFNIDEHDDNTFNEEPQVFIKYDVPNGSYSAKEELI